MITGRTYTRRALLSLSAAAVLGVVAAPPAAEARKKKKKKSPNVVGTWTGTMQGEHQERSVILTISDQDRRSGQLGGTVTVGGHNSPLTDGLIKKTTINGKFEVLAGEAVMPIAFNLKCDKRGTEGEGDWVAQVGNPFPVDGGTIELTKQ